ncbi:unnamed protein product [Fraxinus pennsylvanica]|uniref:Uncharacterized protein n=1 Tax=Fraxinus pennsylvanica TaxID=56036 RepID=A0AAD2E5M5_9LAMI|nr:unnamed protein product [Fraxinus pennsylvanica]
MGFLSPYLRLDYSHYIEMPYACESQASSTTNAVNINHLLEPRSNATQLQLTAPDIPPLSAKIGVSVEDLAALQSLDAVWDMDSGKVNGKQKRYYLGRHAQPQTSDSVTTYLPFEIESSYVILPHNENDIIHPGDSPTAESSNRELELVYEVEVNTDERIQGTEIDQTTSVYNEAIDTQIDGGAKLESGVDIDAQDVILRRGHHMASTFTDQIVEDESQMECLHQESSEIMVWHHSMDSDSYTQG